MLCACSSRAIGRTAAMLTMAVFMSRSVCGRGSHDNVYVSRKCAPISENCARQRMRGLASLPGFPCASVGCVVLWHRGGHHATTHDLPGLDMGRRSPSKLAERKLDAGQPTRRKSLGTPSAVRGGICRGRKRHSQHRPCEPAPHSTDEPRAGTDRITPIEEVGRPPDRLSQLARTLLGSGLMPASECLRCRLRISRCSCPAGVALFVFSLPPHSSMLHRQPITSALLVWGLPARHPFALCGRPRVSCRVLPRVAQGR